MREIWLLYSNGNHYDALLSKDHPLLTTGIISETKGDEEVQKEIIDDDDTNITDKDKLINDLKKRLKQSEQSKQKTESMYREAEKQIKMVGEENHRLRINVKDLNEYIKEKENIATSTLKNQENTKKVCKFIWKDTRTPESGLLIEDSEEMHNCNQCSFQSTISAALSKHMNLKHRTAKEQSSGVFKCADCNTQFSEKWNLMNHRINNHEITEVCE
jgi:chromosome segregation ATPase